MSLEECNQEFLFEWEHLDLENLEMKAENIEHLNLFDLADYDCPSLKAENLFDSRDEISVEDFLTDFADLKNLNEIFKDNIAIESEGQEAVTSERVHHKNVKRLDNKKQKSKEAVLRYKSKKLQKREELFKECQAYIQKNSDLKRKIEDLRIEISLIKSLLVEALISKR
jgi:hypothetical protein